MTANEKTIAEFESKLRSFISKYEDMKTECELLREDNIALTSRIRLLETEIKQSQNDYQTLQTARMISITDGDYEKTKQRLSHLIRKIDRCLALLKSDTDV